jgi:benzodiazapine receptor
MLLFNRSWKALAGFISLIVFVQLVGNIATMPEIPTWYAGLNKALWNPPPWVFGPIWTVLYIMIALAGWCLWIHTPGTFSDKIKTPALRYYFIQLLLNFLWSPVFFRLHLTALALTIILLMMIFVGLTLREAKRVDRVAFWLLVPYMVWITYASTLNAAIIWLN